MITVTFRRSRSRRCAISTIVESKENKARNLISWKMPSLGQVPSLILSVVTVARAKVKLGPRPKNKLGLCNRVFLSFCPNNWFVKNCWFESNRLNRLSFLKQVIWT